MPIRKIAVALIVCLSTLGLGQIVRPVQDDVFYLFMPIAWRNGSGTGNFGDFKGMTASLPYLKSLGITAVWMTPIFPSPAYHGYQYVQGDKVNPRFGTEADFRDFLHAAHQDGIKVFIDFVAYGVGQQNPDFINAYKNPSSPFSSMFAWTDKAQDAFQGYSFTTWDGTNMGFVYWDMNNGAASTLELNWARKWLNPAYGSYSDAGVDGFRIDHAVDSNDPYGPNGLGYTKTHFWVPFKNSIKAQFPNFYMFGEQADWSLFGNTFEPPFDAIFTKPLEFALRSSASSGTTDALMQSLASTVMSQPSAGTYLGTFGDHDVDRLITVIGDDFGKGKMVAALQMAQPYTPIVYYGDEIGMHGSQNRGYVGDAMAIPFREPFKWNAVAGPPMSNYDVYNSLAFHNRIEKDNDGRSVAEQDKVPGSLLNTYRSLIAIRKGSNELKRGAYEPIQVNNNKVISFVRRYSNSAVLVVANLVNAPITSKLNLSGYAIPNGSETPIDLITGMNENTIDNATKADYSISLQGYGYKYIKLNLSPSVPLFPRVDGFMPSFQRTGITYYQDQPSTLGAGAQLDEARMMLYGNRLYLGFTGNLEGAGQETLVILLSAAAGGQNTLRTKNATGGPSGITALDGTRLPQGFYANSMACVNIYNGVYFADWYNLSSSGTATHLFRGSDLPNRLQTTIGGSGSFNPNLLQVGENSATIAPGTPFNSVATGTELSIPLTDIPGASPGKYPVSVIAFLLKNDGTVSNQFLPALPAAQKSLGVAPNLSAYGVHPMVSYPVDLDAFLASSSTVVGGKQIQCFLTMAEPAPSNGLKVKLFSNNAALSVPPTVTIPAGSYNTIFSASASTVTSPVNVRLVAQAGQTNLTLNLEVLAK